VEGEKQTKQSNQQSKPSLLKGTNLPPIETTDEFSFVSNSAVLQFTNQSKTVQWQQSSSCCWIPVPTSSKLYGGKFFVEFTVDHMASRQIGLGFLLDWNVGPDWGFYGYLGSSTTGWSYDPSSGDIVTATESMAGSLPKFSGQTGTIALNFNLPLDSAGVAEFVIDGVPLSNTLITLPASAVVIPAVCLLKEGQKVSFTKCVKL